MQHLFGNGNKKVSSSSRIIKSQLQTNFYHFCIWSLRQNMLDIKCNIFMQYISKSFGTNANLEDVQQNNLPYAKFMNMICDLQCINHIFCSVHVSTPVYISVCTCLIFTLFTFPNLGHHSSPVPVPDVATWQDSIFTYISIIYR